MSKNTCPQPANCDFENDEYNFCSWLNVNNTIDKFDWIKYSSGDSQQFGQVPDNTFEDITGHFMLANGQKYQDFARIVSENMPRTSDGGVCLTFYYYFSGTSSQNLTVKLEEYNKKVVYLWSLLDTQSNLSSWRLGQVFIRTQDTYRVNFEGYAGYDTRHFIGILKILILTKFGKANKLE